ncbi:MAG: hypothetical protein D6788_03380 [Planctomycetota bacterium]|nr:MAG: hypothetical protein D6788_03380 [Planctomycetota bacterium]
MSERPVPDVLALIVCDQIITDRLTGKQSLIGMFSKIHARGFPAAHPQLCVYCALTEGYGDTDLTIRVVDADEARPPIVEGRGKVRFKDPRAIANLALQFHGLTFPEPGEYRVQIWSGGALLREARLELVHMKFPPRARPQEPPASPGDAPDPSAPSG